VPGFVDRVAVEALKVRPARIVLTVLALPFYVLGIVIGLLFVIAKFALGAIKVGIDDMRARCAPSAPALASADDVGD
jgi:ABC-type sulfate transport system permease subunit